MVDSSEDFLVSDDNVAPRTQRWGKAALAAGAVCALLLVGFATGSHSQAFSKEVAPVGLNQIAVIPPREECAKSGANCIEQKCCKITGYECYEVHAGFAQCMKSCTPGPDKTCLHHARPMVPSKRSQITQAQNTLFCWTFYAQDTGSTKKNYQLELMRTQLFLNAGIFGCEEYRVYGDVETWLSPKGINTIKVDDVEGNFHFDHRKKTGTWINSNMFIAAWKLIKAEGAWTKWDWTVKADIDAVFLPMRLRTYLNKVEVTDNGIYLETCKYVSYGFFGSLAVVSNEATRRYVANLDDCKASLNYMGKEKVAGYQPWGEDLFQQRCMDLHKVDKVAAYDLHFDASCEAWRPEGEKKNAKWRPDCSTTNTAGMHPFKTPKEYFECLKAAQPPQ